MPRGAPISMSFSSFRGFTRRLVLANAVCFFVFALGGWVAPRAIAWLQLHLLLQPAAVMHGEVWQLVTYSFLNLSLLSALFALMSLWFTGTMLEGAFNQRWVAELYFASVIGGGVVATALSYAHLPTVGPASVAVGAWSGVFGWLIAFAVFFGEQEILFMFVIRMKAKYLVALYIIVDVALLLTSADGFAALVQLSAALCGYLYVKRAPSRGLGFGLSEGVYGARNSYYRWKRRRAAKKFTVYMRKQNREVHFDGSGKYIDPDDVIRGDGGQRDPRDPNDKRWMN